MIVLISLTKEKPENSQYMKYITNPVFKYSPIKENRI